MDEEKKKLFEELRELAKSDLSKYQLAETLINNMDDAAVLNMVIGEFEIPLMLIHVEVIQYFREFLKKTIEYYKNEVEG